MDGNREITKEKGLGKESEKKPNARKREVQLGLYEQKLEFFRHEIKPRNTSV
jgi:hypothetical protein